MVVVIIVYSRGATPLLTQAENSQPIGTFLVGRWAVKKGKTKQIAHFEILYG